MLHQYVEGVHSTKLNLLAHHIVQIRMMFHLLISIILFLSIGITQSQVIMLPPPTVREIIVSPIFKQVSLCGGSLQVYEDEVKIIKPVVRLPKKMFPG